MNEDHRLALTPAQEAAIEASVTPEMVEAGIDELAVCGIIINYEWSSEDDLAEAIKAAFVRMEKVRRTSHPGSE